MKAQAQARRNARGTTLPSSRTNLYSHSISLSSAKFFQKFDQIMFPSPQRDKSHEVPPVSKELKDNPKPFQREIEERFEKVSARKSYSFPRQNPEKEPHAEIQQTSSSDSSQNSMKQATVYNLYSQNPGLQSSIFSPKLPSAMLGERLKQKSPKQEIGKVNESKVEKISIIDQSEVKTGKEEGNTGENSKKASGDNTPSSYRKLVSLIEVQLNRIPDQKPADAPQDVLQQNWTKTWLGMMSSSSRNTNKDLCTSNSSFPLSPSGIGTVVEEKKPVGESQGPTLRDKSREKDIDKIGKSSYYLRVSSRARQMEVASTKNLRDAKSNNKSHSREDEQKSFMKVLGVKNLNANSMTLSSWDFSLVKSANAKRSVSPKTNLQVINVNKINLKASNREDNYKTEPIKILDEEDQAKLFREYAKGADTQMRKRSRENNLSLIPDDVKEGKRSIMKEVRKRKNVSSVSHLPGSEFSKALKSGLTSPSRDMSKDSGAVRQEVVRSVVKKPEKKRINSGNVENRAPVSVKQANMSSEYRKSQKSLEKRDASSKGIKSGNSPTKIAKGKGNLEISIGIPFGKMQQQYSIFKEESDGKDTKLGTCVTTVSKSTIFRNLFLNRMRK